MSVEDSIAALLRNFLGRDGRDEQVRVLVERLWDLHSAGARASFLRAQERGEDSCHHLHDWEELLLAVGSRRRFEELEDFFDSLRGLRLHAEDEYVDWEGEEEEEMAEREEEEEDDDDL